MGSRSRGYLFLCVCVLSLVMSLSVTSLSATSLEKVPELGKNAVALTVKLPTVKPLSKDSLADGLRDVYKAGEFTDVALICAGQTFRAHKCVLATQSEVFKGGLATQPGAPPGSQEVRLADISNPEAVKFMLDFMYRMDAAVWDDYNPRTQEINKDVLRLAQNFKLLGLTERAAHWLVKDLTTGNVVERLTMCEDFGLLELRELILEQLTFNKRALAEVVSSPQIMQYPKLMQSMLQLAATVTMEPAGGDASQPKKKLRKN